MTPRRRRLGVHGLCAALALTFAALHLAAVNFASLRELETTVFDLQLRWRGARPPGPEIAIVVVDEATVRALGRWPLSRHRYAELIETLTRAGTRVVGVDILFSEPEAPLPGDLADLVEAAAAQAGGDELRALAATLRQRSAEADATLADAIATHGRVALPFTFRFGEPAREEEGGLPPPLLRAAYRNVRAGPAETVLPLAPSGVLAPVPVLARAASGLGHAVLAFDVDGAPRFDYPVLEHDFEYLPSLPVRIVQLYRGVPWEEVRVELGRRVAIGDSVVPTDAAMRLPVNYRGPAGTYPTYSMLDVLQGKVTAELLRDRIVLVGAHLFGRRDLVQTPFTAVLPEVERLASVVDAMLHNQHLRRPSEAPLAEALAILLGAFVIAVAVAHLSVAASAAVALGVVGALIGASHALLAAHGLWFFVALPAGALTGVYMAAALWRHGLLDREHRRVQAAFSRYLAPGMVARLAEQPDALRLGGELRELSVLFCDIRSSTTLGERLDPQRLTRVLNEVLAPLSDIVLARNGTIAKFTGDGLMAFWNAPLAEKRHAELGCRAALAMAEAMPAINARLEGELPFAIQIGVAVNTGPAVVGNFGTARRFDYSAMGDAVNVAARLQEETKTYGIPVVIGAATAALVPGFATFPIDRIQVRGRRQPVELCALVGDERRAAEAEFAAMRRGVAALHDATAARDRARIEEALATLDLIAPPSMVALVAAWRRRFAREEEVEAL